MILTVTLNPSVDISYRLDKFKIDEVNRTAVAIKTAGGKGLNVTRVAHTLGADVTATGILGGTIGTFITNQLADQGIKYDFYKINQESRNCIAILHEGKQTEILEAGPYLSELEANQFYYHFIQLINKYDVDVITISGSLPKGFSADVYKNLIRYANKENIPVVLDTSGPALAAILQDSSLKLAAIKPNREELNAMEGETLATNIEDWQAILTTPNYDNCEWVIMSMGKDGAFVKHHSDYYKVSIPTIEVINPVGSGDATVAGIAKAISEKMTAEDLLKTAMTAGMLNTMEAGTGTVNPDLYDEYYKQVQVRKL